MIKFFLSLFLLSFFSACSFKSAPNDWSHKSTNAFSSYTKNFLSSRDVLAKNDLRRAITHAKQSADLTQLARIYLGVCALNISVGISDECSEYRAIEDLVDDNSLKAYDALLTSSLQSYHIDDLPKSYQDFAKDKLNFDYKKVIEDIFDMDKVTSVLISASLIKDEFSFDEIERLIEMSSFNGYKKSAIYWLGIQKTKTQDEIEVKLIEKKIRIMES